MRFGIMKDIDWKMMGALLAQSDGNEQSDFFKAFVSECMSWGTTHQINTQFAEINSKLTPQEIGVLKMITYSDDEPS